MARIENANLTYEGEIGAGISRLTVSFVIQWEESERVAGSSFELDTTLYGKDPSRDDYLHGEAVAYAVNGLATQEVNHRIVLATDRLNEDWGRDEIYARITIRPLVFLPVSANTNQIEGRF
jgi:hypothetical protein